VVTIQNGIVVTLPDDVPVPPGAIVVEPPPAFFDDPSAYRVEGDRLVRLADGENVRLQRRATRLSRDDIRRLKEALDAGKL